MAFRHLHHTGRYGDSFTEDVYTENVIEHHLVHTHSERWTTTKEDASLIKFIQTLDAPLASKDTEVVFFVDDVLVKLKKSVGEFAAAYAASEVDSWKAAHEHILNTFPKTDPSDEHKIEVEFWQHSEGTGGTSTKRRIDVPSWKDIEGNYTASVKKKLNKLLDGKYEPEGGRLVLWYGPPGTGKTWSIRALAWEWREWSSIHYITDPELFFTSSQYMTSVIYGEEKWSEIEEDYVSVDDQGWRLIVVEDAGELISADAKERVGQGLSRLLNTVDGLLGQGLKIMILITTNEPLQKLHTAVVRAGRVASDIKFDALTREEAAAWLKAKGSDIEVPTNPSIARLYAAKAGYLEKEEKEKVGFAI